MKVFSQNNIEPVFSADIKAVGDLSVIYVDAWVTPGWFIRLKKDYANRISAKKGELCEYVAAFESKDEAENELKAIEDGLRQGLKEYRISGDSVWGGPLNEFIKNK